MKCEYGYKLIFDDSHPKQFDGYVREHIIVVEKYLNGVSIPDGCVIHHINENEIDNRIDNLVLLPNQLIHDWIHYCLKIGDFDEAEKFVRYGLNFMKNLKSGRGIQGSIPGGFLKYISKAA